MLLARHGCAAPPRVRDGLQGHRLEADQQPLQERPVTAGVGLMVKQDEPREGFNRLQRERPRPDVVREGGAE